MTHVEPRLGSVLLIFSAIAGTACSSAPPSGSLSSIMADQRMQIVRACMQTPERFGFPYTRREYMQWRRDLGRWMPDLHQHCFTAARRIVK